MKNITLGRTGITVPQNGFGALPIQRDTKEVAVSLLRQAYEGGMRYFDTARAYSDSEEKLGMAFEGMYDKIFVATKTAAKTPEQFWKDLETSLSMLKTDCIDVYQFHQVEQCWKPGDGSGMYECMLQAKEEGKIRHIGVTAHKINVAYECVESDLYETMQFPFSYLSGEKELKLVEMCREHNMGYIAMKGLAGGLINRGEAAMAYMQQFDNVLPIWGVQRQKELDEWLSYMDRTPEMTDEIRAYIERMSLMLRRAPSEAWLTEEWQEKMAKIDDCVNCNKCRTKCPYELNTPELLRQNLADYRKVLAGEVSVK